MNPIFKNLSKSISCAAAAALFSTQLQAQTEWQNWNALEVQGSITSKIALRGNFLKANDLTNGYKPTFTQVAFQASYDYNRQWDFQGGVQFITPATSRETRTRLFVRAAHTTRIANRFTWTNSLRAETNSKEETRFRQRIIFTTRLGLRKRLDFLNLAPSVAYTMFYNIGGNPIRYYDQEAQLIARQTPDGFHRSRFTLNLNSKVNDYLRISLYYMRQQEFNLFASDTL
jgi:long-subunit fatty acid transport protein